MTAPVRLLILSDLHPEFSNFQPPNHDFYDIAILAGDICTGTAAVRWALRPSNFGGRAALLVPGNHEFYGSKRTRRLEELRAAAAGTHVHLLDRDEVIMNGVRFLGTTLWTDFKLDVANGTDVAQAMRDATIGLNDFCGPIREQRPDESRPRRFTPEDAAHEHTLSRACLPERLHAPVDPAVLATVVAAHHAPSQLSMDPIFEGSALDPCFYSDLPASFFQTSSLWVHGHAHNSSDYRVGGTRKVANPRGYRRRGANENQDFDPCLVSTICAETLKRDGADHG